MNKLTWVEVGLIIEPGRYDCKYGSVEVTVDDLWVWKKYPNAIFVVMTPSPFSGTLIVGSALLNYGMIGICCAAKEPMKSKRHLRNSSHRRIED